MRVDWREVCAALLPAAVLALWTIAAVAIVFATLTFIIIANGLREVLDVGSVR